MKKVLSIAVICALLVCGTAIPISAEKTASPLPFTLTAPGNVSASLVGSDSPTTSNLSYTLNNEMTSFFSQLTQATDNDTAAEFLSAYDITEIYLTTQVDWALDDVNDAVSGWHYNEYWDGNEEYEFNLGCDAEGREMFSCWDGVDMGVGNTCDTANNHWVTRGVTEDDLNGFPEIGKPGLKNQLRPEQYDYQDDALTIDFTQHTMYYRMRFVVKTVKEFESGWTNKYYYSDWSNIACVGKDAEAFTPLTADDLPAPQISDLRMTDDEFNDNPVVAFTLTVPDELSANLAKVEAVGGTIWVVTEARVIGDAEFREIQMGDWSVRAGEVTGYLISLTTEERPVVPKDADIELRCRYLCIQPEQEDIHSGYSQVINFNTGKALLGDADSNGKVNIFDASYIQKSLAGVYGYPNYQKIPADSTLFLVADADGNGKINIFDASLIQKYIAGDASAQGLGIGEALNA